MSRKLKKFYKSKEGKKMLEENLRKIEKDLENEKEWFSKEEDEYWEEFQDD